MTTLMNVYLDNQFIHHNLFVTLKADKSVDNDALGRSLKSQWSVQKSAFFIRCSNQGNLPLTPSSV